MAKRWLFTILACAGLAACASAPIVETTGLLNVRSVSVRLKPGIEAASDLRGALEQATSAALVGGDPDGRPARVNISIDQVGYRNVLEQLVVPSANAMTTTVTIHDESGTALTSFSESVVLDPAFGGVLGAAGALSQDRAAVDRGFVEAYAKKIRARLYGPAGYRPRVLPAAEPGRLGTPVVGPSQPLRREPDPADPA